MAATKAGSKKESDVMVEDQANEGFSLPNEIVKLQYVKRQKGTITNPKHIAYGGMIEGAYREFVPKKSPDTFKYIQVLIKEEQDFLEDALGMTKGDLNLYKKENNFWDSVKFSIPKEGRNLHLDVPIEYIWYKVLLTYENTIAKSLAELKTTDLLTYSFVMLRENEVDNAEVAAFNVNKEAYAIATRLETSANAMREFLYLTGLRVTSDVSLNWLIGKIGKMAKDEPQKVVDVYTARDYITRSFIAKGVLAGVIKDSGGSYTTEDGFPLCEVDMVPSLSNAIKYLADPKNHAVKSQIEAKIG